jgi:lipid-A-disaccharide synthase
MPRSILITAGEASGDLHASHLIRDLKYINANLYFYGLGGKRMREAGVELIENMEKGLSIIGVSEIFAQMGHIRALFKNLERKIAENPPDLAILVDYPGFNLVLAKMLKKKGIPVVYYITPQVWAWGKFRIRFMRKYIHKAIVILRFEEELFKKYGVDATFVGHPLLDHAVNENARESYGVSDYAPTVALLPGSRVSEVKRMLPLMLKTARRILDEKLVEFILLKSTSVSDEIYREILAGHKVSVTEIRGDTYGCLAASDFVFTCSGTATLECAIMERPMLITYKTSFLTSFLFKLFARTRYIGLVNVIAGRQVAPEILQYDANPRRLADVILSIISSEERMEEQVRELRLLKRTLGSPGASRRAAQIIDNILYRTPRKMPEKQLT